MPEHTPRRRARQYMFVLLAESPLHNTHRTSSEDEQAAVTRRGHDLGGDAVGGAFCLAVWAAKLQGHHEAAAAHIYDGVALRQLHQALRQRRGNISGFRHDHGVTCARPRPGTSTLNPKPYVAAVRQHHQAASQGVGSARPQRCTRLSVTQRRFRDNRLISSKPSLAAVHLQQACGGLTCSPAPAASRARQRSAAGSPPGWCR